MSDDIEQTAMEVIAELKRLGWRARPGDGPATIEVGRGDFWFAAVKIDASDVSAAVGELADEIDAELLAALRGEGGDDAPALNDGERAQIRNSAVEIRSGQALRSARERHLERERGAR